MSTIEEVIKRCETIAKNSYAIADLYNADSGMYPGIYLAYETRCREYAQLHEQYAGWLKELKAYREAMLYLFTTEPDGYTLHKYTNEYGYVIQSTDVISAFNGVRDIQNENLKREDTE